MSVGGLCQLCERREATQQCGNCGALVCGRHYDPGRGLCADCAASARPTDDAGDRYRF